MWYDVFMGEFLSHKDQQVAVGILRSLLKWGLIVPTVVVALVTVMAGMLAVAVGISIADFILPLISEAAYAWSLMAIYAIWAIWFLATVFFVTIGSPDGSKNLATLWYPRRLVCTTLTVVTADFNGLRASAKLVKAKPSFVAGLSPLRL